MRQNEGFQTLEPRPTPPTLLYQCNKHQMNTYCALINIHDGALLAAWFPTATM